MSRIICVAGNLGTGKTILAQGLAAKIGWQIVPRQSYDQTYLQDLFQNPERWSFEAQMSFLSHKARNIFRAVGAGIDFVVDRSIYEDIEIFAKHFFDEGYMDKRAYETYTDYANLILESVPNPIAIIYCTCSPEESRNRLMDRPRPYQSLYPPEHIENLYSRYEEWGPNEVIAPVYKLDTFQNDVRSANVIEQVVEDLLVLLASKQNSYNKQLELFSFLDTPATSPASNTPKLLSQVNIGVQQRKFDTGIFVAGRKKSSKAGSPLVYIAAPFTNIASVDVQHVEMSSDEYRQPSLFPLEHGVIPAHYRSTLNNVSRAFKLKGYDVLLPHRDINKWGNKQLSPSIIGQMCIKAVTDCDLFFGILADSFGAHFEAGIAIAASKPCILVRIKSQQETFMGTAIRESGRVVSIELEEISEIFTLIASEAFNEALESAGVLARTYDK